MSETENIIADMKELYCNDNRPWVLGFSGGKDSTCTLQLVYRMLFSLPENKRIKTVHVLSSDTMVEAPVVGIRQRKICKMIEESTKKDNLPISVELLQPQISDTFWVNLIGRGYPAPNRWFRWCTDRLKIKPMNNYILNNIKENGEVIIVLGARKSESASRSHSLSKHEIENTKLRKHTNIPGAFVYTPIEDLEESDVWEYLDSNPSPWGDDNSILHDLYHKKEDDVSFVIDKNTPPSGHSRFGCWVCTVVDKDKALMSLIEDGHPEYKPLLEFRNNLREMRDSEDCREKFRKMQRNDKFMYECYGTKIEKQKHCDHNVLGPFKMSVRHELLKNLLEIQNEIQKSSPDVQLITPEEIQAIKLLWIYEGDNPNNDENSIDDLVDRLLKIEDDMSVLSRRIGVYKKLQDVVIEYTMNEMTSKVEKGSIPIDHTTELKDDN